MIEKLPKPARYFPPEKGVYEVAANLRRLGTDFGNGAADSKIIQLDCDWARYRTNKEACHQERLSKYYCLHNWSSDQHNGVVLKLLQIFSNDWPEHFVLNKTQETLKLDCKLTKEVLVFTLDGGFKGVERLPSQRGPFYQDGIDALCCQIQEDLGIMSLGEDRNSVLNVAHICAAGHWAPEEKIGKNFVDIHSPVPGSGPMNRGATGLVEGAVMKGPFVRFTWSLVTDLRLNHHTVPPPGVRAEDWDGRSFNPERPELHVRVERQILVGIPELRCFLFFIRPLYTSGESIKSDPRERDLFSKALQSMSPDSRLYKGVAKSLPHILDWLHG